jgi:hypothetical protein
VYTSAFESVGEAMIVGHLHTPSAPGDGILIASAGTTVEPVTVAPPCDCGAPMPIAAFVSSAAAKNDDTGALLAKDSFARVTSPLDVHLPCGAYYFEGVDIRNDVTLHVDGNVAVFVEGDLRVHGNLSFDVTGGSADVFVDGNVGVFGGFGSTTAPAAVRLYMVGTDLELGRGGVGANVYAPAARFSPSGGFELSGALVVRDLDSIGTFAVHYDESILATPGCAGGDGECTSCHACSGATGACKAGHCAACASDAECCAPLACKAGRCTLE